MMRKHFLAGVALVSAFSALAAPADLDPSFGSGGILVTNFSVADGSASAQALVQQPDGKIVAAGSSWNGSSRDFALARFNIDGTLDASFGAAGVVVTAMAGRDDVGQAVALQPDGKIVVAGYVVEEWVLDAPRPRFAVARYQADGTLDPTFGTGGKVLTSVGEPDQFGPMDGFAYAVVIQPDGKILAAGYAVHPSPPHERAVVVRYLGDGTLDATFGASGKAVAPFTTTNHGYALALQADGMILLAGRVLGSTFDLAATRFDSAGALDADFGNGGAARISVGTHSEAHAVLLQPDGRIVLAGPGAVARLTPSGQPDPTFGASAGFVSRGGSAAVLESDGRIVLAGNTPGPTFGSIGDFRISRLMPDGSPDAGFGTGGEAVTAVEAAYPDAAFAVLRTAEGKYVAGGFAESAGLPARFALVGYLPNGKLDAAWGTGGVARASPGNSDDQMFALAVLPDGRIVTAGQTFNAGTASYELALARFLPSGQPDPSFGSGGRAVTALSPYNEEISALAVQPDGKIVAAGRTFGPSGGTSDMLVARYLPDGSLDTSFGGTGSVLIDFAGGSDRAAAVALRPDGKIVLGGYAAVGPHFEFAAAQLLPNGELDTGFGANGIFHVSLRAFAHEFVQGIALQADGAILLAGGSDDSSYGKGLTLVRLTAAGALDASFGQGGIVLDPLNALTGANAVLLQPDGKIVVGGYKGLADSDCLVRRYLPDGSLDSSFGAGGTAVVAGACAALYTLALQPNGKIVGAGTSNVQSFGFADVPVLRLNADGTRDTTFGTNGVQLFKLGTLNDAGLGIAVRHTGRIVIGGYIDAGASRDFVLMQLEGDRMLAEPADLDGDRRSDILWRNAATGENYSYSMNGLSIVKEGHLRAVPDLDWQIAGVGDFNGDGAADILWRNASTGENYVYLMNGFSIANEGYLRTVADQNWQVAGVGDFDDDGMDDILWRNRATGENYVYFMNGVSIVNEGYLRTVADPAWQIAGIGDFDGDHKADILWRNSNTGHNYLYPMNGRAIKPTEGFLRTVPDTRWEVKGVGDFDGDDRADILWRHNATGQNYLFPMIGTSIKPTEGNLRTVADLVWQIVAVGDYDGDSKCDILWRNASTGENYLWPMNGTAIKPGEGALRTVADQNWKPQR